MDAEILVVDLDKTLIKTDLMMRSMRAVLRKNPFLIFAVIAWFVRGKGYLKMRLAERFALHPQKLPYRQLVLDYVKKRKAAGARVVLATAAAQNYAQAVADYLKIFDEVLASNQNFNLSGRNKARVLVQKFGIKKFDYIGDHMRDLSIWRVSNRAILVNVSARVLRKTKNLKRLILEN